MIKRLSERCKGRSALQSVAIGSWHFIDIFVYIDVITVTQISVSLWDKRSGTSVVNKTEDFVTLCEQVNQCDMHLFIHNQICAHFSMSYKTTNRVFH